MSLRLTPAQRAALDHVRAVAGVRRPEALARLAGHDVERLLADVRQRGRVTLNFHPDRPAGTGRTVVEGLLADGRYRSQFETGISNGGRTAYPGGMRDNLEYGMFGGAYNPSGVTAAERPVYGGLDLHGCLDGASPRFGSCHLRLRPEVLERATFCHGDSYLGPVDRGTIDVFEPVLAGIVHAVPPEDPIDDYVEAQVHGPVRLAVDVEALIVDPSFRGTPAGTGLETLAERHGFDLVWHSDCTLAVDAVPDDIRGPAMPRLAADLRDRYGAETIDAALVGRAAAEIVTDPAAWQAWGTTDEALQLIKQLWHVLAICRGAARSA